MTAAWIALLSMSTAAAAGLATNVDSDGGTFHLVLKPLATPVPFNELFELQVDVSLLKALDDPNPFWISLDTTMPGHGHGMNTRARIDGPEVIAGGGGRFIVRGLLRHMQGEWEFAFDVAKGRTHEKAKVRFVLE
jgi:hypothetical protein